LFTKKLVGKKCLIVDKTYTGKTLETVSSLVWQEGGIPIKLGLFPKNRHRAVANADLVLFLDRVLNAQKIDTVLGWANQLYLSVLSLTES
jgi:hypothetical protein